MNLQKVLETARSMGWSDIQLAEAMECGRETVRLARLNGRDISFNKGMRALDIVKENIKPEEYWDE